MRKLIAGLTATLMLSMAIPASAQQCAVTAKRAPHAGANQWMVTGFVCGSREAAIAAARHHLDTGLGRAKVAKYVNDARQELACKDVSNLYAEPLGAPFEARDQFGRPVTLVVWEVTFEQRKFLGISAAYGRC